MMPSWVTTAAQHTVHGLWDGLFNIGQVILVVLWDAVLTLYNLLTPRKRAVATVWPEFVPPLETDSRGPCPALNALSNHGILPHDGRGITFKQLAKEVHTHYNCAPTLCFFVCNWMAGILRRNYSTDKLDLSDTCVHNGIEHDGSMTRYDAIRQPDQSVPAEKLILELIAASKDGKKLTPADFSRVITARWAHSKMTNGQFSLSGFHSAFGAGNAATLLLILGGEVADIRPFLLEERIPQGWASKVHSRVGLTMASFNAMSYRVLLGVDPAWQKASQE